MAQINFTAQATTTNNEFSPLPNGVYSTIISRTDVTFKNGVGDLFIEYTVTDGEHANRRIFEHIRFESEIGKTILSILLNCIGIQSLTDSDQLLGKRIAVRTEQSDRDGKTYVNVRGHEAIKSSEPPHKFTPADTVPF